MEWARRLEAWSLSGARPRFVLKESDLALTCGAGNGAVRSLGTLPKGPGTIPKRYPQVFGKRGCAVIGIIPPNRGFPFDKSS